MALADITDPQAVLSAMTEFDDLGRDAFLATHGYGRAVRYFVVHDGKAYDSKAILGVAYGYQFPDLGPLSNDSFSGGEYRVKPRFEALGFDVQVLDPADGSADEQRPIASILQEILDLQHEWSKDNTSEMHERGLLVRRDAARAIRAMLPPASTLPFVAEVEGQDGSGLKSRVPFVRVFSRSQSPSPTTGWYVVLLFAADGSAAYLALGTSATVVEAGNMKTRSEAWLSERIEWAHEVLADEAKPDLKIPIELADTGRLGELYEKGSAYAYRYPVTALPEDEQFRHDLETLLSLLSRIYGEEEPEGSTGSSTDRSEHLLLKWNSNQDPETVSKHRAVELQKGSVWWGNATQGARVVPTGRVQAFRTQIEDGVPTFAYFYRSGPSEEIWRGRVDEITNDVAQVDIERVPEYYDLDQHRNIYVRVHDLENVDGEWFQTHIALASNPIEGSLAPGLHNQTSPLYVVEIEPTEGSLVTRKWLTERTLWPESKLEDVLDVLLGGSPQVILAGPPGTGKSWIALAVTRYLTQADNRRSRFVQFHPSYAYENFIQGLRPVVEDGKVNFALVEGTVIRLAEAARLDNRPHVLVMDELNRANVPRVLGELMFLFEYRDQIIDLQYSPGFSLPPNLAFIATMNTADRSIRSIDVALRRRFEIFECLPDASILEKYYKHPDHQNYVPDLVTGFSMLNEALEDAVDRHHTIGQTFFMTGEMTVDRLRQIWHRQIYPLIEEYFFDLPDLAMDFTLGKFWPSTSG